MISNDQFKQSKALAVDFGDPRLEMQTAHDAEPIALGLDPLSMSLSLASMVQVSTVTKQKTTLGLQASVTATTAAVEVQKRDSASPSKQPEDSPSTLLHRVCQQFSQDRFVVKTTLNLDPSAARRRASISATPEKKDLAETRDRFVAFPQRSKRSAPRKEAFSYPINIALNHGASFDVLAMLVCVAPNVLAQEDGSNRLCSLSLALTKRPQDTRVVELILTINPRAVAAPDRRHNLPLHVACQKGCPLSIVRQLYGLNRDALQAKNFHGETPLTIAQRNSKCPENVLNFLQSR